MIGGIWMQAAIATLAGLIPGLLLFEWAASPFGGLWKASPMFSRLILTVSQFLRGTGVLVKRASGRYELGTYLEEEGRVQLKGETLPVEEGRTSWGLFGRKRLGVTWEPGTDLHERAMVDEGDASADGGGWTINMAAVHRYLEGTNDSDAITRTEEHSKAEHDGNDQGISQLVMALLVMVNMLLGAATAWFMIG